VAKASIILVACSTSIAIIVPSVVMEECLHAWRIVGDLCGSLMEVYEQDPPKRFGGLRGA